MKRGAHFSKLLALSSGLIGLGAWASSAASGSSAPASQPLPTPFPEARYERMSARSPFAVAAAAATSSATPGFATQLYVDGVAHALNTDFVGIKSRDPDKPATIFLAVGKSTEDGLKVERVQWSDETGKSTVEVSKGGETATLEFDEATVKVASAVQPMAMVRPALADYSLANQGDGHGPPIPPNLRNTRRAQILMRTGH